jgi:hypothetical protein
MNAADFVKAIRSQVGNGYWYGTYVPNIGTESLLTYKAKQYPNQYTPEYIQRCRKWMGKPVCDCVGLVKGTIWVADHNGAYQPASDLSADGMYDRCTEKGPIQTIPEVPGILVHKDSHLGVYIGSGVVVESRGVDYGVVQTNLKDRPWTGWGKCHLVAYPSADYKALYESTLKELEETQKQLAVAQAAGNEARALYESVRMKVKAYQKAHTDLEGIA